MKNTCNSEKSAITYRHPVFCMHTCMIYLCPFISHRNDKALCKNNNYSNIRDLVSRDVSFLRRNVKYVRKWCVYIYIA